MAVAVRTTLYICAALVSGVAWATTALPAAAQSVDPLDSASQDAGSQTQSSETTFDFSGDYAPDQWQVRSRNAGGGFRFDGMDAGGTSASSLTLVGSDLGGTDGCQTTPLPDYCAPGFTALFVQIQVPESSIIQFDWDYITYDVSPAFDPFGYVLPEFDSLGQLIEGQFVSITDPDGGISQSGEFSIQVDANQFFAFQIGTLDNQYGPAVVTIDQFSVTSLEPDLGTPPVVTVPEPGSAIALTLSSLSLLALRRRRASS